MMSMATIQDDFARALLDPAGGTAAGTTTARGSVDPARFNIYRNNVFVGLTRALERRFPVVRRLVGAEFFAGMARVYAGKEKPESPLMFQYGDGFPDFIAAFGPAAGLAYLPDVASIEAAWTRAYHAADTEPLDVGTLTALSEDIGQCRLAPHASATLLSSDYPAGSIWSENQSPETGRIIFRPETVLVVRPAHQVSVHVLPAGDRGFVEAIFGGASLVEAAAAAAQNNPSFEFGSTLVGLTSLGAFAKPEEDHRR